MIGIYLIKENRLLCCHQMLEHIRCIKAVEEKLVDWDRWFSIIVNEEQARIRDRIDTFFATHNADSLTLCYHILDGDLSKKYIRHEIQIHEVKHQLIALNYLYNISLIEKIEKCFGRNGDAIHGVSYSYKKNTISLREQQVLSLIGDGYSSKQIADKLNISNHTAISHRKNLIIKFQVRNTAQLIKKASRVIGL